MELNAPGNSALNAGTPPPPLPPATPPVPPPLTGTPPTLAALQMLGNGVLQFGFTNTPGTFITVPSTTNLWLPFTNWTVAGTASNTA